MLDDPGWAQTPWTGPSGDDPLVLVALWSTFQDHAGASLSSGKAVAGLPLGEMSDAGRQ